MALTLAQQISNVERKIVQDPTDLIHERITKLESEIEKKQAALNKIICENNMIIAVAKEVLSDRGA